MYFQGFINTDSLTHSLGVMFWSIWNLPTMCCTGNMIWWRRISTQTYSAETVDLNFSLFTWQSGQTSLVNNGKIKKGTAFKGQIILWKLFQVIIWSFVYGIKGYFCTVYITTEWVANPNCDMSTARNFYDLTQRFDYTLERLLENNPTFKCTCYSEKSRPLRWEILIAYGT